MGQHARMYGAAWRKARAAFLAEHPLCRMCGQLGQVTPATRVDHVIPHRGDVELFWLESNWQPLCQPCHDRHKQRAEKSGRVAGCDERGWPLDPSHHWHNQR